MFPLPPNYANEDNSIDTEVPEAPLDPPENLQCSTSQFPTSTHPQRTNDYQQIQGLWNVKTVKYKIACVKGQ